MDCPDRCSDSHGGIYFAWHSALDFEYERLGSPSPRTAARCAWSRLQNSGLQRAWWRRGQFTVVSTPARGLAPPRGPGPPLSYPRNQCRAASRAPPRGAWKAVSIVTSQPQTGQRSLFTVSPFSASRCAEWHVASPRLSSTDLRSGGCAVLGGLLFPVHPRTGRWGSRPSCRSRHLRSLPGPPAAESNTSCTSPNAPCQLFRASGQLGSRQLSGSLGATESVGTQSEDGARSRVVTQDRHIGGSRTSQDSIWVRARALPRRLWSPPSFLSPPRPSSAPRGRPRRTGC
jgi:hypothetical protein